MYEKKIPENFECGISVTLRVLGGKWKPLIIEYLQIGMRRPSELYRAMDQANPRVISMALKELEDYDVVYKKIYHEIPLRVEYFLTPLGESLLPVVDLMEEWGNVHRETVMPDYSMPEEKPLCREEEKCTQVAAGKNEEHY